MASEKPAHAGFTPRSSGLLLLAAALLIVVFAYALANVSMRLQRHITARTQWTQDQRQFAADYSRLSGAAAAQDDLAYELLLQVAQDDLGSLRRDSDAMHSRGSAERLNLLTGFKLCLAGSAAAFRMQPPAQLQACQQLLATAH